ncbi:MAG: TIGR02186 family protein [Pikeienuella sp.]
MIRLLATFLVFIATPLWAENERVVAALSQNAVSITTDFAGSQIFVYGAVERNWFPNDTDDNLDVIITISGPEEPVVIRKKARALGIWVNREKVVVDKAPSFYAVATTGPLADILTRVDDRRHKISVERAIRLVGVAGEVDDPAEFSDAVVRLRRASGVYFERIGDVEQIGQTLFQTRVELPANIVEGDYLTRVFILREGMVLDSFETGITVRKVGLERFVYNLAHEQSLIYGILSVLVALFAGWAASEVFRVFRR